MKKNNFKPSSFKYEPVKQESKPYWMHDVEAHVNPRVGIANILTVLAIFALLYLAWRVLG